MISKTKKEIIIGANPLLNLKFNYSRVNLTEEDYDNFDCFDRPPKKTVNNNKEKILEFWKCHPLRTILNFRNDNKMGCMACGHTRGMYGLDSAHILAISDGGSNYENNLHLLCRPCHKQSETLNGWTYWLWIGIMSKIYINGSDMTFEVDYKDSESYELDRDENGKLKWSKEYMREYPMEGKYKEKLNKYWQEYAILSRLKRWELEQQLAEMYLKHSDHLLKIKFENINLIPKIDEYINILNIMGIEEMEKMSQEDICKFIKDAKRRTEKEEKILWNKAHQNKQSYRRS